MKRNVVGGEFEKQFMAMIEQHKIDDEMEGKLTEIQMRITMLEERIGRFH